MQITSEYYFQSRILLNPFIDDKVLVKIDDGLLGISFDDKWMLIGNLNLKIEHPFNNSYRGRIS